MGEGSQSPRPPHRLGPLAHTGSEGGGASSLAGRERGERELGNRLAKKPTTHDAVFVLDLLLAGSHNSFMSDPAAELRVEIKGLMLDPSSNVPIVILRDVENQLFLPIWIGISEAQAIASRIEGIEPPRPMTHDLLRALVDQLGGKVVKVVISDLKENTFFAALHLEQGGKDLVVDARPSDAIALALRANAPIFVLQGVLDQAQAVDLATKATDQEKLKKWLEEISPEELGKYTM
jgi:uncharacterized protein